MFVFRAAQKKRHMCQDFQASLSELIDSESLYVTFLCKWLFLVVSMATQHSYLTSDLWQISSEQLKITHLRSTQTGRHSRRRNVCILIFRLFSTNFCLSFAHKSFILLYYFHNCRASAHKSDWLLWDCYHISLMEKIMTTPHRQNVICWNNKNKSINFCLVWLLLKCHKGDGGLDAFTATPLRYFIVWQISTRSVGVLSELS